MTNLAVEAAFDGMSFNTLLPEKIGMWQHFALVARSFGPGIWLLFSLTYSRGNYREFVNRWRIVLVLAFLLPVSVVLSRASHYELIRIQPHLEPFEVGVTWWRSFSPTANVLKDGLVYIYYGCCDTSIGLATVPLDELVEHTMRGK